MTSSDNALTHSIEQRLAERLPPVELLACERVAAERLRLTIDHPDGVDLGLCERVTKELAELREQYGIEVSSPGPERPLTKPDHFRRFIGRRARVRTRVPLGGSAPKSSSRAPDPIPGRSADRSSIGRAPDPILDGQRSFTGELVGASDAEVTIAADVGVVSIPYTEIVASNLTSRAEASARAGERGKA
jgi:ribosome maturation factor RimP